MTATQQPRWTEYVPLDSLTPALKNPKAHADGEIRGAIGEFGYVEPILVDERTGRMVGGHGRRENLIQMRDSGEDPPDGIMAADGDWLVPVTRGWSSRSDQQADALIIALNNLPMKGGWDKNTLAEMMEGLLDSPPSTLVATGFSAVDVDRMLSDLTKSGASPSSLLRDGVGLISRGEEGDAPPVAPWDRDDLSGGDDGDGVPYRQTFGVVVTCEDADAQRLALVDLRTLGYKVRAISSE